MEVSMESVELILKEKGSEVRSINKDSTIEECSKKMTEHRVGALLVMQGDEPIGILSERDIIGRVLSKGLDFKTTKVVDVMSKDLIIITKDTPIKEAMAIMTEKRCRHLPVMDGKKVIGLISIGDLNRWYSKDYEFTIKHLKDYIAGLYK